MRILVVEDERLLCDGIAEDLELEKYTVERCYDGADAYERLFVEPYDLVILDLNLPGMDGLELLRRIRSERPELRVLILSARAQLSDKVAGLDLGADDYLTKPFSVDELLARVRASLRRGGWGHGDAPDSVYVNGALRVDYAAGRAWLHDEPLHLTPIEYKLLCVLARNTGKVLTHNFILGEVWGGSWENDVASLRVFMRALRKKIEADPSRPVYIQTHVGVGYRMQRVE